MRAVTDKLGLLEWVGVYWYEFEVCVINMESVQFSKNLTGSRYTGITMVHKTLAQFILETFWQILMLINAVKASMKNDDCKK